MKRATLKIFPILLLSLLLISSCSNNDDNKNSNIKVELKVVTTGTLSNSSTLEYRKADGSIATETLTSPNTWTKTFNVQDAFQLFLKTRGTIEGSITLEAKATGNGVNYVGNNQISFGSASSFDLEVNKSL